MMTDVPQSHKEDAVIAHRPSADAPTSPRPDAPAPPDPGVPLRDRIAVLPGTERVAYRPGVLLVELVVDAENQESANDIGDDDLRDLVNGALEAGGRTIPDAVDRVFDSARDAEDVVGVWFKLTGVPDAPRETGTIDVEVTRGDSTVNVTLHSRLDYVYFASDPSCCGCPPHPSLTTSPVANPWSPNPWAPNPWSPNPWSPNPWSPNAEALNVAATGKPPTSSAMPALQPQASTLPQNVGADVVIGILDSGLAGEVWDASSQGWDQMCPELLISPLVTGELDLPDASIDGVIDGYLDPVAGHGTFIAGVIQQRVPGCKLHVGKVFHPEGDVDTSWLGCRLWDFMTTVRPKLVNLSFGGAGSTPDGAFERAIRHFHEAHDVVFVAAAGNEGTCVEQYPAAMPEVIGVGALGPNGPAPWTNYGPWVDTCAPGTDIVSSFFANFDGELPRINGLDPDNFDGWATWSGTSFAAPVVVAALAREMATTGCSAREAVERVVRAAHLARFPNLGTIVNY